MADHGRGDITDPSTERRTTRATAPWAAGWRHTVALIGWFAQPYLVMLLLAAAVSALLRDVVDAAVIVLLVTISAVVGSIRDARRSPRSRPTPAVVTRPVPQRLLVEVLIGCAGVALLVGWLRAMPPGVLATLAAGVVVVGVPAALVAVVTCDWHLLRYGLVLGCAEVLVLVVGPVMGLATPLVPGQILWLNLLTVGLPGVVAAIAAASSGNAQQSDGAERTVSGEWRDRAVAGVVLGVAALVTGVVAYHTGVPWRSMLFIVLGLGHLAVVLAWPHRSGAAVGVPAAWVATAVALAAGLLVAVSYLPVVRLVFGTLPLSVGQLTTCLIVATLVGVVCGVLSRSLGGSDKARQ